MLKSIALKVVCLVLLISFQAGYAAQTILLDLPAGQEVELKQFKAQGDNLILWLPSERGFSPAYDAHGNALAALGIEVWMADLHTSYFVNTDRNSLSQFPLEDIVSLIQIAILSNKKNVYILSASRGAQIALIAAREWQLMGANLEKLRGLILLQANLYRQQTGLAGNADYLPVVAATNLPVYLLDAEFSTRSLRTAELAAALEKGGGRVYTRQLRGIQAGFVAREVTELEPFDLAARRALPAILQTAISRLARSQPPRSAVMTSISTTQLSTYQRPQLAMKKISKPQVAHTMLLKDIDGLSHALEDYAGQVVLVNFWASWCAPCIKEIPSLHRLEKHLKNSSFRIISVNVGEPAERIREFMKKIPVRFPVLLDTGGEVARNWGVYVYPSNYLIDTRGRIQYFHFGALEWDHPDNIALVKGLLEPLELNE